MPDFDPTPPPGRLGAQGPGPRSASIDPEGAPVDGADPPTVRSGSSGSVARRPSARAATIPLPEPGERIADFALEESIGAGGMGAVFRAADIKLDRYVALKILPPDQAVDPEVVQRYYQEGRAAARLDHENIARVFTIGFDGRYHFIAFEYIEGTTIRQEVEARGPLAVDESINLTLQIAGALVHAALRGVVHRDIKPSNIIITPQGRAKLVDMGLARRFERGDDTGLTQSGMTLGTFDYISPEQARDPRDVDIRGDLYSLGCTLFFMLSGQPPFPEGTVTQKLLQHQKDAPPDIRTLNPDVPDGLASILVRLMAKDRDRRYQSPEQLARDLVTLSDSLGLRPAGPEGLAWSPAGPAPAWERHVAWGVPSLAFVVALGALAWWGEGPNPAPPLIDPPGMVIPRPPVGRPQPPIAKPVPDDEELPQNIAVGPGDDLLRVLAEAPKRATILLVDNGPYELRGGPGRKLANLDVSIKADAGVRPVLKMAADVARAGGHAASPLLDVANGKLAIDGVEFQVEADGLAAIRIEDSELTVRRCWFRRAGLAHGVHTDRPTAILARGPMRPGSAVEKVAAVTADGCYFAGGQASVIGSGTVDLSFRDCSLGQAPGSLANFWIDNPEPGAVPAEIRLGHVSVLAGAGPVFRFGGTAPRVRVSDSAFGPPGSSPATLVAIDAPERLDWRGVDNVYARIGSYLQPAVVGAGRLPIRTFDAWADDSSAFREAGSVSAEIHPWDDPDPLATLADNPVDPARAFRLALPRTAPLRAGARHGPAGPVPPPITLPASVAVAPGPGRPRKPPDEPKAPAPTPILPDPPDEDFPDDMAPMPMPMPGPGRGQAAPREEEPIDEADWPEFTPTPMPPTRDPMVGPPVLGPNPPWIGEPPANPPAPAGANEASGVIRTAEQFIEAMNRPGPAARTFTVACDADWVLPTCRVRGPSRWVIRAEKGATRPRFRFRADPTRPAVAWDWPSLFAVEAGGLRLEGIDIVLAEADAPFPGRWAAFEVRPGNNDLSLEDCTVTIEGTSTRSAVVAATTGEGAFLPLIPTPLLGSPAPSSPGLSRVRIKDSLLRAGGDLLDVAAGRALDLDIEDAAIATGGSLVHGHGLPPSRSAQKIRVGVRQSSARMSGGLVLLESAPGEPALPVTEIVARDSVLTTADPNAPLVRIDGREDLDRLQDQVRWEGRRVAYHRLNVYRRDQTSLAGERPREFDQDLWEMATGWGEESPIHGDLQFANEWSPGRPAWTLTREDVRLRPESPASSAGPDLARIPDPPSAPRLP